jgi:two-component system sensor kinase FixL
MSSDLNGKEMVAMITEEQARLKSIVETAVDGIVTIDERGVIETVNPAAEILFGHTATELVGRNVSILMPNPYRSEHDEYLARYLATGKQHIIGSGREVTGQRKDGTTFPMRLSVGEFWLGRRRMFTGVIHDLTQQKRAEERALQSERLAAMGQMISVLTHESRNALQITQANLEMLAVELPEHVEALGYVARIQSSQDRLHSLFEELRTFAGPMVLDREPCSLDRIVDRALRQLTEAGIKKHVQVYHESHGVDLQCTVDQFRMERVFCNLLDNSLAACPDPVAIRASWSDVRLDDHPALELVLFDNGPGLSDELRQRIFEPFFTTKPKGTGLGLAITKRIIESHGGRIALGNDRHAGAEFIITLPREHLAVA